ncbi:hypothetical protein C8J56DRAFT_949888, partial [Mycena floridula]
YHLTQHVKFYMSSKVDRFEVGEGGVSGVIVRQEGGSTGQRQGNRNQGFGRRYDDEDPAITDADGSITLKRPATDYLCEAAPASSTPSASGGESKATEEGNPATASALAAGALALGPKVRIGAESGKYPVSGFCCLFWCCANSIFGRRYRSFVAGVLGGGSVFGIDSHFYRRVEHWNVAGNHSCPIGTTIAGKGEVTSFRRPEGEQLRYCGYSIGFDEVIVKGDFVAYYVKESMQHDPVCAKAAQLMHLGKMRRARGKNERRGKNELERIEELNETM